MNLRASKLDHLKSVQQAGLSLAFPAYGYIIDRFASRVQVFILCYPAVFFIAVIVSVCCLNMKSCS